MAAAVEVDHVERHAQHIRLEVPQQRQRLARGRTCRLAPADNEDRLVHLTGDHAGFCHQQQRAGVDKDEVIHGAQARQQFVKGTCAKHVMRRMSVQRQRQNVQHRLVILDDGIRQLACAEQVFHKTDLRFQACHFRELTAAEVAIDHQRARARHGRHAAEAERQTCLAFIWQ